MFRGYTGQEEQAQAEFGRTLAGIGSQLLFETIQKKESEEYSNAIGRFIDEMDDYYQWQRENADKPDEFTNELDRRRESMQTNILKDVRTPGAKAKITNKFTMDFARMKAGADEDAYRQAKTNKQVAFDINLNKITDIPADKVLSGEDVQQLIDSVIHLVDENYGDVDRLMTPEQQELTENNAYQSILSTYILQNARSPEDIDKANDIAREFELDPVFNAAEIDDLKAEYNQRLRRQQADLKALQDAKEDELLVGILNNEIGDENAIKSALSNGEIDASAARRLINDLKIGVKTDDLAYSKINDAIYDYGSGRIDRESLDKVFKENRSKIGKDDKASLNKKISSERDKYLDDQTRTGHKIISNILFSSFGGDIFDNVTGEVNWGKLISGGKATAEEIAAYRKGTIIFNAWFDDLVAKDKTPREEDIIYRALKIGNQVKREVSAGTISPTLSEMKGKEGTPAIVDPSQKPIGVYNDKNSVILNEYGFEWLIRWTGSRDPNVLRKFASEHNMVIPK